MRAPRTSLGMAGLIGLSVVLILAFMALIIGLNIAIAYFFVYKVAVNLGAARWQAFAIAIFYYVVSGLSSTIYFAGRKKS